MSEGLVELHAIKRFQLTPQMNYFTIIVTILVVSWINHYWNYVEVQVLELIYNR